MFDLRNYQIIGKNEVRNVFVSGKKRVVLCSPTGSGKTVTFASIAVDSVKNGTTVLIVVDRKELLNQSREKLIEYGLNPSLITANQRTFQSNSYIATIETLVRRPIIMNTFAKTERLLVIIDECHKQIFDKILKSHIFQHAYIIGATATPKRSGKMNQMSSFYNAMVTPTTISELISSGHLVPATTFGANFDVSNIKLKGGEFDTQSMFSEFNRPALYSGVVEKYQKHTPGTRAICFCVNVEHSKKTCESFRNAGIVAEHIDGTTPNHMRQNIISEFKKGNIKIITNCDILTTGFDDPGIETVIVNRATKSLSLWLQMCGRGSRPFPKKESFNILDLGGNVFRLGFWEEEREYSLTHKTKDSTDAAPLKTCPMCECLCYATAKICPHCKHVFEVKEKKLIDAEFAAIVNQKQIPENLKGKTLEQMTISELEQYREFKKYKIGWIIREILRRPDLSLEEFANLKGYKTSWIKIQENIYSH